jgi:hypothetical protein
VESGVAEALGGSQSECDEDGEEDQFLHRVDPIRTRTDSPVWLSQLLLAQLLLAQLLLAQDGPQTLRGVEALRP